MRPGALVADRFEIESVAGEGGMGTVWRAHDRAHARPVALKVMLRASGEDVARFAREVRVLRELSHPGIVRYVADGVTDEGEPWLAMEWLEGVDLASKLARGPLPAREAVSVCVAIADALGFAHALGLVHRDLKPSNVYLVGDEPLQVKLLDFGVVRRLDARESIARTQVGALIGTPGYVSPEQARGDSDVSARADVFALGCVLFECLTGVPVFSGDQLMAVLAKVLLEEAPRLATVAGAPAELDSLVARMLSKAAAERPADALEVARALRALEPVVQDWAAGGLRPAASIAPRPMSGLAMSREQVWLCALVVDAKLVRWDDAPLAPAGDASVAFVNDATLPSEAAALEAMAIARAAEASGARRVGLAVGAQVLVWQGAGAPADMVTRAARAALSIRAAMPGVRQGLASGRASLDAAVPLGAALERAVSCVKRSAGEIEVDAAVARLLDVSFEVSRSSGGATLVGEGPHAPADSTLLGVRLPCFGREVELSTLSLTFAEVREDSVAAPVLVTGEAGVGKSRIRHAWTTQLRASHPDAQVWLAQGDVMAEGATFGIAVALVADACGIGLGTSRQQAQRQIGERVAARVAEAERSRVASRLCEMCGVGWESDVDAALQHGRREPIALGDQLRAAWEDFLVAECTHSPVLLVVEDVQWADRPSLELIDRALRNFGELPWMVLAVGRPELEQKYPKLWSGRGAREVRVGPLKAKAAERLVRAALGTELPAERAAAIVEHAAGNAYFLEELIRAEAEGRGGELPESVVAMVEARLLRLELESRRVLRAASVFGATFEARGVAKLLAGAAVEATLEALTRQELLAALPSGGYAFRQATVREAAYAQLLDDDRAAGHARAAAWLVSEAEKDAAKVAEHYERGAEPLQAAAWWAVAAEQALQGNDFAGAIARAESAVACGAQGDSLARAMLVKGDAHSWRGEPRMQLDAARSASAVADLEADLRLRAISLVANAATKLGDSSLFGACVDEALAALRRRPAADDVVESACKIASSCLLAGQTRTAAALCEVLDQLDRDGIVRGPACCARIMVLTAHRAFFAVDYESNLHACTKAADAFHAAGDQRNAMTYRGDSGHALLLLGAHEEAVATLRIAVGESSRIGLPHSVAAAQMNLGVALGRIGAFDEADQVERAALHRFCAGGNGLMEACSRAYLSRIWLAAGRQADAESEARRAPTMLAPDHPMRFFASVVLADALVARGDDAALAEALDLAQGAFDALRADPVRMYAPAFVRRVHVDALEASGLHEAARAARDEARAWVLDCASKTRSEHSRRTFLHGDPDNARIMGRGVDATD